MHRFYCKNFNLTKNTNIIINEKDEIHHLHNVLRLKKGDQINIFNGNFEEAYGEILSINSREVLVKIYNVNKFKQKIPKTILACALPKRGKFEAIIEKATELDIDEIIPIKTQRTEVNISKDKLQKKNIRFQTVAINASKQCKRPTIPIIHQITEFKMAVKNLTQSSTVIMPSLIGKRLNTFDALVKIKKPKIVSFLVGPEGDFTNKEYEFAHSKGCIPVSLGKTVLKVDTAALCIISCINQYYFRK